MTILTLVRHGQTDWNRARRIQGTTDIPLNDTGRAQAREAASRLAADDAVAQVGLVVASDLSRARETAQIIADRLGLPAPRLYPALRERGYGEAEGLEIDEFTRRWGAGLHEVAIPGAESHADVRRRALDGLRQVVADARAQTAPAATAVIVVSHGALIREVLRHASGGTLPRPSERLDNGSAHTVLVERERMRLLSYTPIAA